jgi:hypothetical protein
MGLRGWKNKRTGIWAWKEGRKEGGKEGRKVDVCGDKRKQKRMEQARVVGGG